jgi:hypothetical protein
VGEAFADTGDPRVPAIAEQLRPLVPIAADALLARVALHDGRVADATTLLVSIFERYRSDPWPSLPMMGRSLDVALAIARVDRASAARLAEALSQPFAAHALAERRWATRLALAKRLDFGATCAAIIEEVEPHPPRRASFLADRLRCYELTNDPRRDAAAVDLAELLAESGSRFTDGLDPSYRGATAEPARE